MITSSWTKIFQATKNLIANKIDYIVVNSEHQANLICNLIPAACPFAKDLNLGHIHIHIPPLCKINPFYDNLVYLRFRAECFLAQGNHV